MCLPVTQLHSRAESLIGEFKQGGGRSYIEEAIDLDREALQLCPSGHPKRHISLTCLANHLRDRYNQFGATGDLEDAIVLDGEALDLCPQGHPKRSTSLHNLALGLFIRYKQLGGMEDLDAVIVLDREALDLFLQGHPDRSMSLNNLAVHLSARYDQLGGMEDLDEAIVLDQQALLLRPQGHPDRSMSLNNLADDLSTRYNRLGETQDLDEAIVLDREALNLRPQGHPDRSMSLNNLAVRLSTRYNQLGGIHDLDEAIILNREALNLRPQGHPDRSMSLNNLGIHLYTRYKRLGGMEDLNEAVVFDREALNLCPQGHPDRSMSLNNLAVHLSTRYDQLGRMEDLDEAIVLNREALHLRPQGHPYRSMSLNNLANVLSTRYKQLGGIVDLDEAIVLDREALALRPQGHPNRSMSLNNLAIRLFARYKQLGGMQDLDESIALDREALDLRPQGHPDRSMSLNNLAVRLSARYNQLGGMQDLHDAIILDREALDLRPQGHPDRPTSLNNLAVRLSARYKQLGATKDLDEAIVLSREALHLCSQGHSLRSDSLNNLACHLCDRFTHLGQLKDKEEVFSLYSQLADIPQIVSSADLSAARIWIRMAHHFQHPTILLAYTTSLRLLAQHLATLPSLPQHLSILRTLTSSLAVDAFSTCIHERALPHAVELLEQGRCVFWSQLTHLRSPLEDVAMSGPAGKVLADEFARVALLIRNALNSPGPDQHERLCHLNFEMHGVVTHVRELPGLSRFILPSLFPDLQRAACGGPVIIVNASEHSCDALIVVLDRDPVHIPLQITQEGVRDLSMELHTLTVRARRADVMRELAAFLRKLWDQIVSPIVDFLQTIHPSRSRIWWCPTAEFSVLPLHAAGPFRKGQRNLVDIYISSYTPTLTALIRARRRDPSRSATRRKRFIAIGQAKAAGENELNSVGAELDTVSQRVDGLATFTRIEGEESCISRVVEELGKNDWVHLACHGLPNPRKPFESAFALRDGHFTIEHIIGCELKDPEFAYLSACHTTVGDEESPDEAIHLASAVQFVGFRSVIGTMWAVDDGETNKITSTFYRYMVDGSGHLDHTRAAFALNKTMKSVDVPFDQRILYIHLGA
ncbi:CHAT domain-containing protein [Boletus coccyginus]|nr:CHAT domain-containing protein [Boletus coccyginus]